MASFSASLDMSVTAWEQASRRYCRVYEYRSTVVVSSSDETPHLGPDLYDSVPLVSTDPLYSVFRKKETERFGYYELSVSDMKATIEFVTDLLRPGDHTVAFCTAQHFAI